MHHSQAQVEHSEHTNRATGFLPSPARWFVTGASSGLGRAIVECALADGDLVIATVRRKGSLNDLVEEHGTRLSVQHLDLSNPRELDPVIEPLINTNDSIDVVVNNAGYGAVGALEELKDSHIRHQLETMLVSPIRITRAFVPLMRRQGYGRIIQIASVGGQVAYPGGSVYHAAKWGLEGFTESVRQEVAEFGIRFTIVEPGATRTNFHSNMVYAPALPAYAESAVGQFRRFVSGADDSVFIADPAKLARTIVASTRQAEPPFRLTLGGDAYEAIDVSLSERLDALRQHEHLARSAEFG